MYGVSTRKGTTRTAVKKLGNQQQGELARANYAAHFAPNQRMHVNLLIDNMVATFSSRNLKISPKAPSQTRIVRNPFNHLWWTGIMLHLFRVTPRVMPAYPVSRIRQVSCHFPGKAMVEARNKWNTIMKDLQLIHLMGFVRV